MARVVTERSGTRPALHRGRGGPAGHRARDLLADRCSAGRGAEAGRVGRAVRPATCGRRSSREIGVAGLLVPEEYGGAGASAREARCVLEELGRAVAPVPFLTSAVLATAGAARGPAERRAGLADCCAGSRGRTTAALVVSFAASPYRPRPGPVGEPGRRGLSGTVIRGRGARRWPTCCWCRVGGDAVRGRGRATPRSRSCRRWT